MTKTEQIADEMDDNMTSNQTTGKVLDELDIINIRILANCIRRNERSLMISVDQGVIDADRHRSVITHCFHANSVEEAIPKIIARTKLQSAIGELLKTH